MVKEHDTPTPSGRICDTIHRKIDTGTDAPTIPYIEFQTGLKGKYTSGLNQASKNNSFCLGRKNLYPNNAPYSMLSRVIPLAVSA